MGREIRKVSKDWEHPRGERGHYQPMYAEPYVDVSKEWLRENALWEKGVHPDQKKYGHDAAACKTFAEWTSPPPDPRYYNQYKWTEQGACCFQFYETVTEGTPLSPVFDSLNDLSEWLIETQEYSRKYAEELCRVGWASTFIATACADTKPDLKKEKPKPVPPAKKRKGRLL